MPNNDDLINNLNDDLPTNVFTIDDEDPMVILGKLNAVIKLLKNIEDDYQQKLTEEQLEAVNSGINSSKVAQIETNKNNIAQLSNPNLLINGNFKINQRGSSSYVSATSSTPTYMIDRWAMTWAGSLTSINDNSISIQFVRQYSTFKQMIENYKDFKGKTLTASFKIANLSATSGVYIRISDGVGNSSKEINSASGTFTVTRTIDANATELTVNIFNTLTSGTITLDIEYIKLEIGEIATPFSPRPYAEELLLCKRYYQIIRTPELIGFPRLTTEIRIPFNYEIEMRTIPTIKQKNALSIFDMVTFTQLTQTTSSFYGLFINSKNAILRFTYFSNLVVGHAHFANDNVDLLTLDAEIY